MAHLTIRLAETVVQVGLRAVHGEPLDTPRGRLVPVALVGFGVGGGSDNAENGGGGGGAYELPLGAYEITEAGTRFVPNTTILAFVVLSGFASVLRALRRK